MKLLEVLSNDPIVVYSGRFQPFGVHHFETYKNLINKFGKDKVYIATSNVTNDKSPFSFTEKRKIISTHGIPSSKIVNVKSPYKATELLEKIPNEVPVIFAFGKKDAGRLKSGKYFDYYKKNINLKGHSDKGYIYIIPHVSLKINGNEISGTEIRKIFGSNIEEKQKKVFFKKIMGFYNNDIYNLFVNKLS